MSEVIEESFEYRRDMLGPIDRCNVTCGSYGDKFHRWDDSGPYVEYEDHVKHISLYSAELDTQRLRADTAEAELEVLRQQHAEQSCIFCNNSGELLSAVKTERSRGDAAVGDANEAERRLAAAEQRIEKMAKVLTDIRQSCELSHLRDAQIDAALNSNPEAESHE